MQPFENFTGLVVPLDRSNVDTDAIMPKQFLKSIKKTGYGDFIFDEWRYMDKSYLGIDCSKRIINPDFTLNKEKYKGASILLTRENFGCGSSREHAVWGLKEFGFKVIIAPSFADIFYNNSIKNILLPIVLPNDRIDMLFEQVCNNIGYKLKILLKEQSIILPDNTSYKFDIDLGIKSRLLQGLDDIALTLQHKQEIISYEKQRKILEPWIFYNASN